MMWCFMKEIRCLLYTSLEIIREYEDRISTIISEPDHGMYEAINKGIRVATGAFMTLTLSYIRKSIASKRRNCSGKPVWAKI